MSQTEPEEAWLPTTEQILMASERAILAALDTNLLLAVRTLRAEHPAALGQQPSDEPSPPAPGNRRVDSRSAASLRELVAPATGP